ELSALELSRQKSGTSNLARIEILIPLLQLFHCRHEPALPDDVIVPDVDAPTGTGDRAVSERAPTHRLVVIVVEVRDRHAERRENLLSRELPQRFGGHTLHDHAE